MTKFIVNLMHNGQKWPLRGTVWAFSMDRATQYDSREAAQAALDKARKFMKAAQYKATKIEEAAGVSTQEIGTHEQASAAVTL